MTHINHLLFATTLCTSLTVSHYIHCNDDDDDVLSLKTYMCDNCISCTIKTNKKYKTQ